MHCIGIGQAASDISRRDHQSHLSCVIDPRRTDRLLGLGRPRTRFSPWCRNSMSCPYTSPLLDALATPTEDHYGLYTCSNVIKYTILARRYLYNGRGMHPVVGEWRHADRSAQRQAGRMLCLPVRLAAQTRNVLQPRYRGPRAQRTPHVVCMDWIV